MNNTRNIMIFPVWMEWAPYETGNTFERMQAVNYLNQWKNAQQAKVRFMNPDYEMREFEWINPVVQENVSVVGIKVIFDRR